MKQQNITDKLPSILSALVALLVFSLPFERIPSIDLLNGQVTLRPNQLIAFILILMSGSALWAAKGKMVKLPRVFLLIFLFLLLLGAMLSIDLGAGVRVFVATSLTVLTAIAISVAGRIKDIDKYETALVWGAWVAIVFGMFQYFGDTFGLSQSVTGLASNYVKAVFGFPRIQSTALEPLFFASFLLIPFCVLSARQLIAGKTRAVTLFAVTTTIVLTVSRGAIAAGVLVAIGFVGAACLYGKRDWKRVLSYIGLIVAAAVFAYLLTFVSSLTVSSKGDKKFTAEKKTKQLTAQALNFDSQDDRVRNRKIAWQAFRAHPVMGIGPGNFDRYAKEVYVGYRQAPRVIVNNEPLELLAETGLIGFTSLLSFFIALIYAVYRFITPRFVGGSLGDNSGVWAVGLTAYLGATAIQYQTFSTLYIMHIWVAIGLLMMIVLSEGEEGSRGVKKEKPSK